MNEFIPRGYLPLERALEHFGRQRETAKLSDIGREALDHELENTEKASSKQEFQQLLFEKTVPAKHFIGGRLLPLESSIWGRGEAEYIFASGWATIHGGNEYFPAEVRGPVLIKQSSIDALFDGDAATDDLGQQKESPAETAEPAISPAGSGETETDPYHSGAPGKPTGMHLVEKEFDRRVEGDAIEQTMTAQATALLKWYSKAHPQGPRLTAKTIKNKLASSYRAAKAPDIK